ncbi:tripartite tricarboxylate transporter TctB family protein [Halobellus rufus]|uniref:tripartite tricarboxylate transporter TctB family protein n=1 Tax=Halobellus rufus TaxID=1448860 RepID=UPI0006791A7C|nr:tripartite tricarboxylate transporter TctB family protein [Halobellus rufus]
MVEIDGRAFSGPHKHILEFVRRVDGRYWSAVFFACIFAYTTLLVVESFSYSAAARLFPLIVGISLLGLVAVQIAVLLAGDRLDIKRVELFGSPEEFLEDEGDTEQEDLLRYQREFEMILWTTLAVAVIWLLGHVLGLVVFVFFFVYRFNRNLKKAGMVTGIAFVFVYLLFVRLLDSSLWTGILFKGGGLW